MTVINPPQTVGHVQYNSESTQYRGRGLNFIASGSATITVAEDTINDEVDVTISSPASGSVAAANVTGSLSLITQSGLLPLARGTSGSLSLVSSSGLLPLSRGVLETLAIEFGGTNASNAGVARTNLGLGSLATQNSVALATDTTGSLSLIVQSGLLPLGTGISGSLALIANSGLLPLATGTSGTLSVASGGTGTSNAAGITAILDTFTSTLKGLAPSSSGGTSNFLRADGTWNTPAGSNHSILSSTHSDSTAASVVRGDIIVGIGVTPTWQRLAVGTSSQVLHGGTEPSYSAVALASDTSGTLAIVAGGTGQSNTVAAFDALAPTTTKGDIVVHNGTDNIRVAVGTNDQVLTADSAQASGVKWATSSGTDPITVIAGSSGASGSKETWQVLTADATTNSTTTLTTVMTTTGLSSGIYQYTYYVKWQSATTTVGVNFSVNYSGTVTEIVTKRQMGSTGTAAASGVADGVAATLTGQLVEHFATRTNNGSLGPNTGVDTVDANILDEITGILNAGVTGGELTLKHASETATASTVQSGTCLILRKLN